MRWFALVPLIALTACKKRGAEDVGDLVDKAPATALSCPEGAIDFGGRPPVSAEFYCAVGDGAGRWYKHGEAWTFHADGARRSYGHYAMDRKVGHWWFWDETGALLREGTYVDDKESGYWIHYLADGAIHSEGPMHDGGRHGTWVAYDPETGVGNEGAWQYGERHGVWVEYDAEGVARTERVYRAGRLISQREL